MAANEEVHTDAVTEVIGCYDKLAREVFAKAGGQPDTQSIFELLKKASNIVNEKLAKRKTGSILDDSAYKQIFDLKIEGIKNAASPDDKGIVKARAELQAAFGAEHLDQLIAQ